MAIELNASDRVARAAVLKDIEAGKGAEASDLGTAVRKQDDDKPIVNDDDRTVIDPDDGEADEEEDESNEEEGESTDEEETDESEEDEDESDEEDEADPPKTEKTDPELQKRLDQIQKREKQAKAAIARERAELKREQEAFVAEWKPLIQEAQQFKQYAAKVRTNPAAVLMALGLKEEDLDYAARQVHGRSKKAAENPKNREYTDRLERERELEERAINAERLAQQALERLNQTEQQKTEQENLDRYLKGVVQSVQAEEHPLVAKLLKKTPEKARRMLHQTAERLWNETGEVPDHSDVVAALEQERREELEELDVDLSHLVTTSKKKTPEAREKKRQKTLSPTHGNPKKPRPAPLSRKELEKQTLRELEEGRLE